MKKIFVFVLFLLFTSTNYSFGADCSEFKTLSHKWNLCKFGKIKGKVSNSGTEIETQTQAKDDNQSEGFLSKLKSKTKKLKSKSLWGIVKGEQN